MGVPFAACAPVTSPERRKGTAPKTENLCPACGLAGPPYEHLDCYRAMEGLVDFDNPDPGDE
jgi:hypothetical protein